MAKSVKVSIVHNEMGKIASISRPTEGATVVVLSGNNQAVFVTEVDENSVGGLINSHRVDISRNSLVPH